MPAIPDIEYRWQEWQAYQIGGRMLVPRQPLHKDFQAAIQSAQAAGYPDWMAVDETALDCVANRIAPKLGASTEVTTKGLRVRKCSLGRTDTSFQPYA